MFFKTATVFKMYGTRKGAENFISRTGIAGLVVEEMGGNFYVVAN
jgi:hypothetical protein